MLFLQKIFLMRKTILLFIFLGVFINNYAQINPDDIQIIRDAYGVPHIYAAKDSEVAYGYAWAQAEDHFKLIQKAYLAGNGLLGRRSGLKGAGADF